MNALAQWNQLNEVEDLQHSLGSLFSRPGVHWPEQHLRAPQRIPLVAVSENARGYVLKAELPQVKQEDAKINIDDDTLTITGDHKFDLNRKKDHARRTRLRPLCAQLRRSRLTPAPPRSAPCSKMESSRSILPRAPVPFSPPALCLRPFPTLRLNRRDQFNEPEHKPKSWCHKLCHIL